MLLKTILSIMNINRDSCSASLTGYMPLSICLWLLSAFDCTRENLGYLIFRCYHCALEQDCTYHGVMHPARHPTLNQRNFCFAERAWNVISDNRRLWANLAILKLKGSPQLSPWVATGTKRNKKACWKYHRVGEILKFSAVYDSPSVSMQTP